MDFEKPLEDQIVLVTRPRLASETPLVDKLHAAGAGVILHPVIEIEPPRDWSQVDHALGRLSDFGTIVFLSGTGVEYFFARTRMLSMMDGLDQHAVAAIGESTAQKIREYGESVDLIPTSSNSESMAELLVESATGPILLLRASRGSDVIAKHLEASGKEFDEVVIYESRDVEKPDAKTVELLNDGKIDWVTITSSAIASSTASLFGDSLLQTKLASISPTTTLALRQNGFTPATEASEYNFDGLVAAMSAYTRSPR